MNQKRLLQQEAKRGLGPQLVSKNDPFESKDKTGGKTSRAAPKTPGAMEGDVMMAELEGRDHWRVGNTCAVRVHVERAR